MIQKTQKKNAFITGGSRGIGRGISLVLAEKGYNIAFTYNSSVEDAESLKAELEKLGAYVVFYQASMQEDGVPEKITERAAQDLGGIDLLVCNAGRTKYDSILTLTQEHVDFLYKLNFRSYMMCTRVAVEDMLKRSVPGRIIFISSTRGIRAYPEDNIYGSLKAALIRSVQSLALELAEHNITVNCIAPGATKVRGDISPEGLRKGYLPGKIPLKRFGTPEEIGHLLAFIASDEAGYITGETIRIDGGLILPGMKEKE